ncbi:MAG: dipeptide epimerase [Flavobacteriaceae bacterium]
MWEVQCYSVTLQKKIPLAISRGVRKASNNVFISLSLDSWTGWGEVAPTSDQPELTPEKIQREITRFIAALGIEKSPTKAHALGMAMQIPRTVYAAIDMALWDWWGQKAQLPLYRLWGLPKPSVATSITLGITPPQEVAEQLRVKFQEYAFQALKIKLGNPLGMEADQAMMEAVLQNVPAGVALRVDANGGWTCEQALEMIPWLAQRSVEYVEQPLKQGDEKNLKSLKKQGQLPIFVDESCHLSTDLKEWHTWVDGINIKLMKCGGPTEAIKLKHTAQAFGLQTMIGCMSESSIAISAAAHLSGDIDHIDLDSHYNLNPDPAQGLFWDAGVTQVSDRPGLGTQLNLKDHA